MSKNTSLAPVVERHSKKKGSFMFHILNPERASNLTPRRLQGNGSEPNLTNETDPAKSSHNLASTTGASYPLSQKRNTGLKQPHASIHRVRRFIAEQMATPKQLYITKHMPLNAPPANDAGT